MDIDSAQYGNGDATYRALGGLEGITRLVDRFYSLMDTLPEAATLRAMHARDLADSRQKLVAFLSGWTGGPRLYAEQYGTISLPVAHKHLPIDADTTESWLKCMSLALAEMGHPEPLRVYLMGKFATPAESIRLMSEFEHSKPSQGGGLFDPA